MKRYLTIALLAALPCLAQVDIKQQADRMDITINGAAFSTFFYGSDAPKPYLHPLRTASGKIVTRAYPMQDVEGESKDHPHHRGLWFTHGDVNGFDFWANEARQKGPKKGKIVLDKAGPVAGGKKQGTLQATFNWLDPRGNTLLKEARKMTFYAGRNRRVIDLDITLTAGVDVKFGDTKEGTFAIRLATPLEEPSPKSKGVARTGKMVNAEGLATEKDVWGKRSAWVDYQGELEGEKLGIAILDHPSNPRYPTYWHSRGYGLFAANIFGVRDFTRDKSKDGSLSLEKGKTLRFLYRVVIHPGDARSAQVAKEFKKFSRLK
jgi:hypothetical protein